MYRMSICIESNRFIINGISRLGLFATKRRCELLRNIVISKEIAQSISHRAHIPHHPQTKPTATYTKIPSAPPPHLRNDEQKLMLVIIMIII